MSTYSLTTEAVGRRIKPFKSLGQHFLTDSSYTDKIIEAADLTKEDIVIEIGPGSGAMTGKLCEAAGRVVAIEIDRRFLPTLEKAVSGAENVDIIFADVLKTDLNQLITDSRIRLAMDAGIKNPVVKVVANLPYYITTPIVMKILEGDMNEGNINMENINKEAYTGPIPSMLLLMMQKEVAERITASPGGREYGVLSVITQYFTIPEIRFIVPSAAFYPRPAVDSAVVRMVVRKKPPVEVADKAYLFKLIKAAFGQRRKTLQNAIYNSGMTGLSKEEIAASAVSAGISAGSRAETLSIAQFAKLAEILRSRSGII